MWQLTHDTWHVTHNMWHVTHGGGVEYALKMAAPQLFQFWIDSVLKILNRRMTEWINELIKYAGADPFQCTSTNSKKNTFYSKQQQNSN